MTPLPLPRHHPAPSFDARDPSGQPVSLGDYRFSRELFLLILHGLGCPYCAQLLEQWTAHRNDWEKWGTAALILMTQELALEVEGARVALDPEGEILRRYSGGANADVVMALIDHRGRLMDGWSLNHPEPADWREVAVTVQWMAVQEPECSACEVLPGWE